MNIEAVQAAFAALRNCLVALKTAKELLPKGKNKQKVTEDIEKAEKNIAIAEAQIAKEFGYRLCQCTFPPQIMLFTGASNRYKCPTCGYVKDESPAMAAVVPEARKRFRDLI
jgi:hypothetical protein